VLSVFDVWAYTMSAPSGQVRLTQIGPHFENKSVEILGRQWNFHPTSFEAMSDATVLLNALEQGDAKAADELLNLVYDELRHVAAAKMANQAAGQTLQPTALVHEAWIRLVGAKNPTFRNRTHFFSAAAGAMRHILIDRARRKQTQRHGVRFEHTDLDQLELAAPSPDEELLAIHEVLEDFRLKYPTQAQVVELRYFIGMTNEETSEVLGISVATVSIYWKFSRAWLFKQIRRK
jgi:RNA polymerase sigma factor (TIGR02999 family)